MKTAGYILRETRERKHLTLDQVEKATKIRKKFLESIENDDYSSLPSLAYAKGFVKNYSDFLGLDPSSTLAYYRRQTKETSRQTLLPKKEDVVLSRAFLRMTPGRFLSLLVAGLVTVFLGYLLLQYHAIEKPPMIAIDSPKEGEILKDRRTDILGNTDPDATLIINGVSVLVRSDGKFFDQVLLEEGPNKITITATSRFGKVTTIEREITYQPN